METSGAPASQSHAASSRGFHIATICLLVLIVLILLIMIAAYAPTVSRDDSSLSSKAISVFSSSPPRASGGVQTQNLYPTTTLSDITEGTFYFGAWNGQQRVWSAPVIPGEGPIMSVNVQVDNLMDIRPGSPGRDTATVVMTAVPRYSVKREGTVQLNLTAPGYLVSVEKGEWVSQGGGSSTFVKTILKDLSSPPDNTYYFVPESETPYTEQQPYLKVRIQRSSGGTQPFPAPCDPTTQHFFIVQSTINGGSSFMSLPDNSNRRDPRRGDIALSIHPTGRITAEIVKRGAVNRLVSVNNQTGRVVTVHLNESAAVSFRPGLNNGSTTLPTAPFEQLVARSTIHTY